MGWLWGSSNVSSETTKPSYSDTGSTPDNAVAQIPDPVKQPLSREEQASLDWQELLKEIQAEQDSAKVRRTRAKEGDLSQTVPIPEDISPDSLYSTELSCRSALDYAMFCQSFGGQFVNIYRYGEFRSCSNHWQDFWLCMRTRNWDPKDRARAIQDHNKKKAVRWKTGPSSEDVWEVRNEPVRDAFQDSLEELEAKISRWQRENPGASNPWSPQQGATFKSPQ